MVVFAMLLMVTSIKMEHVYEKNVVEASLVAQSREKNQERDVKMGKKILFGYFLLGFLYATLFRAIFNLTLLK